MVINMGEYPCFGGRGCTLQFLKVMTQQHHLFLKKEKWGKLRFNNQGICEGQAAVLHALLVNFL